MITKTTKTIDNVFSIAMKKVKVSNEIELRKYLPGSTEDSQMHHLVFLKLKKEKPDQLEILIQKHILDVTTPTLLSNKRKKHAVKPKKFDPEILSKLLLLAEKSGDLEISDYLITRMSAKEIRQQLIASLRKFEIDEALWERYKRAAKNLQHSIS